MQARLVALTRVVGVKLLEKNEGMTSLMDLLFFDKGRRIDKKSNTMHCRASSLRCAPRLRPWYLAHLLIDFLHAQTVSKGAQELCATMISVKSVGLMIVGNQLLSSSLQPSWS